MKRRRGEQQSQRRPCGRPVGLSRHATFLNRVTTRANPLGRDASMAPPQQPESPKQDRQCRPIARFRPAAHFRPQSPFAPSPRLSLSRPTGSSGLRTRSSNRRLGPPHPTPPDRCATRKPVLPCALGGTVRFDSGVRMPGNACIPVMIPAVELRMSICSRRPVAAHRVLALDSARRVADRCGPGTW